MLPNSFTHMLISLHKQREDGDERPKEVSSSNLVTPILQEGIPTLNLELKKSCENEFWSLNNLNIVVFVLPLVHLLINHFNLILNSIACSRFF